MCSSTCLSLSRVQLWALTGATDGRNHSQARRRGHNAALSRGSAWQEVRWAWVSGDHISMPKRMQGAI